MNVIVIVDQDYDVVSVITVTTEKAFPKVKERYMEQFREILKRYKESILPNVFTNIEEFYNGDSFGIKYDYSYGINGISHTKDAISYNYSCCEVETDDEINSSHENILNPKVCLKSPDGKHYYVPSADSFELPHCKYCYKE